MKVPEPKEIGKEAMHLIKRILSKAEERISIEDIMKHEFFMKTQPKEFKMPHEIGINQKVVRKMERTHSIHAQVLVQCIEN